MAENVTRLPVRLEPERYLSRPQLARALNVSVATVDRWRKEEGFPQERWGIRTPRFKLSRVEKWLRDRGTRERIAA